MPSLLIAKEQLDFICITLAQVIYSVHLVLQLRTKSYANPPQNNQLLLSLGDKICIIIKFLLIN